MSAIEDIAAERRRQITKERWSSDHDDYHTTSEMACAAAVYAYAATLSDKEAEFHRDALYGVGRGVFSVIRYLWPWEARWFKPKGKRQNLVRAGALIVAEIERLDREQSRKAA